MENSYRIVIRKYAQKDLIDIYNYISKVLSNNATAVQLLNKINDNKLFSKSVPLISNEYVKNKNIRKLLIDSYIAFYEIDEANFEIIIIRIIYGMMNYSKVL